MSTPLGEGFGRNLWRCRRRGGLTQTELSRRAGVDRARIGLFERGHYLPRLDTILKLSGGLEVSPCDLLAGLRWRPGFYIEGEFEVEDGSEWAKRAKAAGR